MAVVIDEFELQSLPPQSVAAPPPPVAPTAPPSPLDIERIVRQHAERLERVWAS